MVSVLKKKILGLQVQENVCSRSKATVVNVAAVASTPSLQLRICEGIGAPLPRSTGALSWSLRGGPPRRRRGAMAGGPLGALQTGPVEPVEGLPGIWTDIGARQLRFFLQPVCLESGPEVL